MKDVWLFCGLLLVYLLSLIDLFITRLVLDTGNAMELNLLLAPIINSVWGLLVKAGVPLFVLGYLWIRRHSNSLRVWRTVQISAVMYGFVVTWNLAVYLFLI